MKNNTERKKIGRTGKTVIAAAIVLMLAGASVYAVSSATQKPPADIRIPAVTIEVQPETQQTQAPAEAKQQTQAPAEAAQQAQASQQTAKPADIGLEKARGIALAEVSGASSGDVFTAYSDYDDGRLEYDVEIHYDGYEYEFEIDGATGRILSKDVERMEYDDYYFYD